MLPCADVIEDAADVPAQYETILDAVALPTADSAPQALQAVLGPDRPGPPNRFAKTGLVVRSGVAFSIKVDHPPSIALIGWGSPADFVSKLASEGCGGTGWIAFAGGLAVREPMCVDLTVTVDDEQESIRVGVGSPCEGQQPPPAP